MHAHFFLDDRVILKKENREGKIRLLQPPLTRYRDYGILSGYFQKLTKRDTVAELLSKDSNLTP